MVKNCYFTNTIREYNNNCVDRQQLKCTTTNFSSVREKKTVESLWSITTEADSEMSQSCDLANSVQAAGSKRAKRRVS